MSTDTSEIKPTMLSYELADAQAMGLDLSKLGALLQRARLEVTEGRVPSCQMALARHGQLVLFETIGDAHPNSRYTYFSVIKVVVAAACWLLMSEGKLDVGETVSRYIPSFTGEGKEHITVEQLLTHTAGLPSAPMNADDWGSREGRLQRMAQWRLNWEPGSRFEYHETSAHWVLAEIIETLGGMDFRAYIQRRVIEPLGLHGPRLGVPAAQQGDINPLIATGEPATAEEILEAFGTPVELPPPRMDILLRFNEPDMRALGMPGGGGIGTAADMALFYQALLRNPGELWQPDILSDATSRIRVDFADPFTGIAANRNLGLIVQGDDGFGSQRGMGRTTSPRTFGHAGIGGQIAWADPASGLSFCFLTNGLDANPIRMGRRGPALSNRAGACVVGGSNV